MKRLVEWLFDPFRYLAGGPALMVGLVVLAITAVLCWQAGIVLDGVFDAHYAHTRPLNYLLLAGADWLVLVALLWVAGRLVARGQFRLLDLAGTLAVARWPMLVVVALMALPPMRRATASAVAAVEKGVTQLEPATMITLTVVGLAGLGLTIWFGWLAWRAYAVSCDVHGKRGVASFLAALLAAEGVTWSFARWLL